MGVRKKLAGETEASSEAVGELVVCASCEEVPYRLEARGQIFAGAARARRRAQPFCVGLSHCALRGCLFGTALSRFEAGRVVAPPIVVLGKRTLDLRLEIGSFEPQFVELFVSLGVAALFEKAHRTFDLRIDTGALLARLGGYGAGEREEEDCRQKSHETG